MQEVLDTLYGEAREFSDHLDQESSVREEQGEVVIVWQEDFERMIYNDLRSSQKVEVGIMLLDENPSGSVDFLSERLSYTDPEVTSSTWDFCYTHANQYGRSDLETYQAGSFL